MTKKSYSHPTVELCRDCEGKGLKYLRHDKDPYSKLDPEVILCPTCNGSGRVVVSKEIITTVKPFKE
ncbi:MAG TPA: hypothetical protein VK152_00255 [Paludibacter sp.]|nr:hypothetical protein [Paludibacter sp.]